MLIETKAIEKSGLHPRNPHRTSYDFTKLVAQYSGLYPYVHTNDYGTSTIDFSDTDAVKALNKALLIDEYDVKNWDIPNGYLCPAIPGRVDYIHYLADLLAMSNNGIIPEGDSVLGLDVGVGANCIYPILGNSVYGWSFLGVDTSDEAIDNCAKIIGNNPRFQDVISLQAQINDRHIFKNIIERDDRFTFTMCNPPFHTSETEAFIENLRKNKNLGIKKNGNSHLNFGGQSGELWCEGGELAFITQMIFESAKYPLQCLWFTTLVSKKSHLSSIYKTLSKVNAADVKTIEMTQGQKQSRFVAWSFFTEKQQQNWKF